MSVQEKRDKVMERDEISDSSPRRPPVRAAAKSVSSSGSPSRSARSQNWRIQTGTECEHLSLVYHRY